MKILLIEDDKDMAQTIRDGLADSYIVDISNTGEEGEYMAEVNDYDLIILDVVLPDKSGVDVCETLRKNEVFSPILMLTGQAEIHKKVSALDSGADDYLTKPFNFHELKARIRALARRKNLKPMNTTLKIDNLVVDTLRKSVKRGDVSIQLRRKEYDLLEYMMRNPGKVITRDMILNHVWENSYESFTNTIDVHVKYLRDLIDKPFDKKLIKTVHGFGYKLEE